MNQAAVEPRDFSPLPKKSPAVRVLVVDDEPLIRWSLAETLLDKGFDVSEAVDGQTTLRVLADAHSPLDVVVLDYRLPDSNDLKLLATVRRLSPASQIILMTAFGSPEVVRGAQRMGAYTVVHKPFEMDDLASLVDEAHQARF